jgi:hypothetical protein
VDHITYSPHNKNGVNMVKVVYYCGNKAFNEFLCPEHPDTPDGRENFAKVKSRKWWKNRCNDSFPTTAAELLELANLIPQATHLRVWVNKQYPEIMAHDLTGTAFGMEAKSEYMPDVDVAETMGRASFHFLKSVREPVAHNSTHKTPVTDIPDVDDDQIPF